MKIEILVTELSKKSEVLTLLAKEPGLQARGNELEVDGLKLEVGEGYLFFTLTSWERAEEIVPLLFSVVPSHSAHIYRLETSMRVLVTCPVKTIPDIIPELVSIEHLDLEAGELAGEFDVTWTSHDVAVTARAELMVQGGVGVARIKFIPHSRDSEYHCRACAGIISFKEVLRVFCREPLEETVEPVIGPIVLEGRSAARGAGWADFVNARPGIPATYDRANGELRLELGPGSYIAIREGEGQAKEVFAHMESPACFTDDLAADLANLLELNEVLVRREISNAALDLDRIRRELGFRLGRGLSEFVRDGYFMTRYDAKKMEVTFEARVSLEAPVWEKVVKLYREVEMLTGRVVACAV